MPKFPPALLLLILLAGGGAMALFLNQKPAPQPAKTVAPKAAPAPAPEPAPTSLRQPVDALPEAGETAPSIITSLMPATPASPGKAGVSKEELEAQVMLLEGQVEYLQGQVNALQDENAQLLQKLGTLGMKGSPKMELPADDDDAPDYVGMGIELMKFRQIQSLPTPTTGASQAEVEKAILAWLRRLQPDEAGPRMGLALTALGWIDKPVDPLPVQAALWARQLGGWFDPVTGTLLIAEQDPAPGKPAPDRPLAIAYGQLLREYGDTLFPPEREVPLTTDERLARESLLAGDAGLTRFLFSLQNPKAAPVSDLPAEDPDHPLNEVQAPVFIRELAMFPFRPGFEFAQTLHSAGQFPQLNAAYSRPPRDCAEIIEAERYLDASSLPPTRPEFPQTKVEGNEPYWDDSLGRFAIFTILRTHNSDEDSGQTARGWQADRLLTYAAPDHPRDHAAWQTQWLTPAHAEMFFKTMRRCLLQRYDADPVKDTENEMTLTHAGRTVHLLRNRSGQGVLLLDAATADFAKALRSTLDPVSKEAP